MNYKIEQKDGVFLVKQEKSNGTFGLVKRFATLKLSKEYITTAGGHEIPVDTGKRKVSKQE